MQKNCVTTKKVCSDQNFGNQKTFVGNQTFGEGKICDN
jgi:hypothetical protein